ncbi:MAG TPA: ATP-grasp domain-containing protein [Anaerolineae bacterium]|nr:ATP-grasp domain-containing protein [Anaerolineae bacterium]HQI83999.1 ATP-grasp domain-containing protein [Anaerolineae bacterium]
MNIVLLSPYFPPNYYHFAMALRRNGVNVLGLGDAPYDQLAYELRAGLVEYYRVDDLHQYDALVRACGYFTHRYGKLDRIESHNEYWLETDARLRTDFNVPGPKTADIAWVKQKSKMKQVFVQAGIAVARGRVVQTLQDAEALIAEVGYPVVAKPDTGVGANATYKIADEAALARFFAEKPPIDYIMEEFVSGALYSFDGLVNQEGKIVFSTSHFFSQGIMEIVNAGLEIYYYSLRDLPPGLADLGERAVAAFDLRERFFHIEFFQLADGSWVALEVNMRPPGGLTMDMFNYANDVNLYQEWANIVAYNYSRVNATRPYHCAYVGRKWTVNHRLSHDEVLRLYGPWIPYHGPMSEVFSPALGHYAYLLRSPDLAELREMIDAILA